ncbi:MAG: methyltransferase domain-containing protein [Rhodopseudomonas sp.]|nr:methyltransferase domain-containing protein [Rhodopseudomonas sp.]
MRQPLKSYLRMVPYIVRQSKAMFGVYPRRCNLCDFSGYFMASGSPPRFDASCPKCGSLERHRLFGLWLDQHKNLISGKEILHFAPEPVLKQILRPMAGSYRTTDLNPASVDVALNIEAIDLPDSSVDVAICSHVLEHVNHWKALAELKRIIRPGGIALLLFPIIEGWDETYLNSNISGAREAELHFGQSDHTRMFGRRVRDDIRGVGFSLREFTAVEPLVSEYGLWRGEKIFVATA